MKVLIITHIVSNYTGLVKRYSIGHLKIPVSRTLNISLCHASSNPIVKRVFSHADESVFVWYFTPNLTRFTPKCGSRGGGSRVFFVPLGSSNGVEH